MNKDEIIKQLRDMAKYPTVTLPRDCEALRAAADLLAQPEQEPVAWGVIASNTGKMCQVEFDYNEVSDINSKWLVPLYTTPPQRTWVGLTKKEVHDLFHPDFEIFHQRIEAKLKDKNGC